MSLPLLGELSVTDVVAIRQFPEWESFKDAQQKILKDPLHYLNRLEPFQESFDRFQLALSDWYNRTYERKKTEQRYCNFVTLALSVGGGGCSPWRARILGRCPTTWGLSQFQS